VLDDALSPVVVGDAEAGEVPAAWVATCGLMCNLLHMATNLAIDDHLLDEALRIGGQRTKKDTVNQALEEYVQRRKQARILALFGKIDFAPAYDHKRQRRRA
jgi:Arc/MetJ family transcription regulator